MRSEESGTTPATRRSPPGPYLQNVSIGLGIKRSAVFAHLCLSLPTLASIDLSCCLSCAIVGPEGSESDKRKGRTEGCLLVAQLPLYLRFDRLCQRN